MSARPPKARPPAQRWRAGTGQGTPTDHGSKSGAYEAAADLLAAGLPARVEHWKHGAWRLHDVITVPEAAAGELERRAADA